MFLIPIVGLLVAYIFIFALFSLFFENKRSFKNKLVLRSVIYPIFMSSVIYFFIFNTLDPFFGWGNRLVHALNGGFITFFLCFLVAKDGDFKINRFQFFIFSFLLVTAFGVFYEIFEFVAQHFFHIEMVIGIEDTWLDLISNSLDYINLFRLNWNHAS